MEMYRSYKIAEKNDTYYFLKELNQNRKNHGRWSESVVFPEFVFSINRSFPPVERLPKKKKTILYDSRPCLVTPILPKDIGYKNSLH